MVQMVQFPIAPGDKKGGVLRIKSIKKQNRFDVILQIFCVQVFLARIGLSFKIKIIYLFMCQFVLCCEPP